MNLLNETQTSDIDFQPAAYRAYRGDHDASNTIDIRHHLRRARCIVNSRARHAVPSAPNRSLSQLNEDADQLLRKLARLRQKLVEMRQDLKQTLASTAPLVEANEQLVLAALHAEAVAETAVSTLGELAHSSQHDPLTELPNRLLLLDRFETAIAAARRHDTRIAVLFVDLDGFKKINDTLGHGVGDQVLQLVARRLQSAVRDSDTVARYGGEEFVVLLPEISQAADAALIAAKLLAAISAPSRIGEHRLDLSASVGITIYPEDGEDATTLINRADAAMYRAKRRGPGGHEFYAEKLSLLRRAGDGSAAA